MIVALRGEIYFVKFIINPEEDYIETEVILGRSFIRLTKGIADFGNGVITIYPKLDPFLDKSEETEKSKDDWELILNGIDFGDNPDIDKAELPQFSILEEARPVIETMAYKEEEAVKRVMGEALKEKEDPSAFVIHIRLEAKINLNTLVDTDSDINVMPFHIYTTLDREEVNPMNQGITMLNHSKAEPMGLLKDVLCQIGVSFIIAKLLILVMPVDKEVPILTFRVAQTSVITEESDSDDEEEYSIKRNNFGAPIYGPNSSRYLNGKNLMDRALALQEVLNPFKKICVWKKAIGFLGSLPVLLQHLDWKPIYSRIFCRKDDRDGQWHAEIRLTDPYGNIYDQG
ncbi:hypothetical protein Tco_1542055, partial [Tanacetum coccineum]